MMKRPSAVLLMLCALAPSLTVAGPLSEGLGTCFADNTTGKDRKELGRWIFTALGAHPGLQDLSTITPQQREEASRTTAALFTMLITERCAKEARAAIQGEGSAAVGAAFGALGRLAVQELQSSPDVASAVGAVEKYIDKKKIQQAISAP